MTAFLQALAETTRDPLTAAVAFALSRGADGCDPAELRAFLGGTHPERVTTYLANLQGVLQLNTLGRLVVMPPTHWPLRRLRRMPFATQLGLPTKDDLVDAMASGLPAPPPVAATPPPAVGRDVTFRRSNVPDLKRLTSNVDVNADAGGGGGGGESLRKKVQAFVGPYDFVRYWCRPEYAALFEEPEQARLVQSALDVSKGKLADGETIGHHGKYLWALFKEFRRQAFVQREA